MASIQDGSENAIRQQLIQTLHRDLMRKNGIPVEWMACHTQVMVSRTRGTGMSAVLVVKQWDERLLNHAFALQRALAKDVTDFEPAAEQWLHGITWRLDVASTCPHIDLPEKSYWNKQYTPMPTAVTANAQKAELVSVKSSLVALQAAFKELQAKLTQSEGKLQSQTSDLAAQAVHLLEARQALAASGAERANQIDGMPHPANRTQFMPYKPARIVADDPALQPSPAASARSAIGAASAPDDSQARYDLDRLFAIRDTALRQTAAAPPVPAVTEKPVAPGYEPTQPAPLRL